MRPKPLPGSKVLQIEYNQNSENEQTIKLPNQNNTIRNNITKTIPLTKKEQPTLTIQSLDKSPNTTMSTNISHTSLDDSVVSAFHSSDMIVDEHDDSLLREIATFPESTYVEDPSSVIG